MIKSLVLFLIFLIPYLGAVEFVLFTQPKTGTHLLIPLLNKLTKKRVYWGQEYVKRPEHLQEDFNDLMCNSHYICYHYERAWKIELFDQVWELNQHKNTFLHLHAPYSPTLENYLIEKDCINFFIIRDPRDQIVSLINHYKHIDWVDKEVELLPTDDERLSYLIRKKSRIQTLRYMKWIHSPVCTVLCFEKLMGAHGGVATDQEALEEVRKIASALKLSLPDCVLQKIYKESFGKGWSFFQGKVGAWKTYFKEEHIALIQEEIGDLLIELGYGW